jgi:hypothetical protein
MTMLLMFIAIASALLMVFFIAGFFSGYGRGWLISCVIVFVCLSFSVGSLIAGALSLTDFDVKTMTEVDSGKYVVVKDCYGKYTKKIGDTSVRNNDFWHSNTFSGDGVCLDSASPAIGSDFIEGEYYTIYQKNAILHYNWIILCGKY